MSVVLLTANLLVIVLPTSSFKQSTTGAMASSYRGESCTKPSKGVFRTQSKIQDGPFVKIVDGVKYLRKRTPS